MSLQATRACSVLGLPELHLPFPAPSPVSTPSRIILLVDAYSPVLLFHALQNAAYTRGVVSFTFYMIPLYSAYIDFVQDNGIYNFCNSA